MVDMKIRIGDAITTHGLQTDMDTFNRLGIVPIIIAFEYFGVSIRTAISCHVS